MIQGSAAELTKLATIYLFNWILEKDYIHTVLITNIVHDELLIECPIELAEEVKGKVKEFMEKSASFYCKTIPMTADPVITETWRH